MRAVSLRKFALVAICMAGLVLAVAPAASATTFGTCAFDATTNTLIVTEGPESSADHGGVDCNLKDVSSGLFSPGGNQFFSLTEAGASASEFPCSDRVDVTNNHVTMISDPRVPDHGLPCTPNRTQVPESIVLRNQPGRISRPDVLPTPRFSATLFSFGYVRSCTEQVIQLCMCIAFWIAARQADQRFAALICPA